MRPSSGGRLRKRRSGLNALQRSVSQHLLDEVSAVVRRECTEAFAGSDEASRNPELVLNCDHYPALSAAVEFRDDHTGQPDGLMKLARLRDRVAAGCCIDDEQRFVR